jgi:predicted Zn-dependent peptidase
MMALESSLARCEHLARQLLIYGRPMPPSEVVDRIDKVDAAALARVSKRIAASQLSLAACGPIGKLEGFAKLSQRFH